MSDLLHVLVLVHLTNIENEHKIFNVKYPLFDTLYFS